MRLLLRAITAAQRPCNYSPPSIGVDRTTDWLRSHRPREASDRRPHPPSYFSFPRHVRSRSFVVSDVALCCWCAYIVLSGRPHNAVALLRFLRRVSGRPRGLAVDRERRISAGTDNEDGNDDDDDDNRLRLAERDRSDCGASPAAGIGAVQLNKQLQSTYVWSWREKAQRRIAGAHITAAVRSRILCAVAGGKDAYVRAVACCGSDSDHLLVSQSTLSIDCPCPLVWIRAQQVAAACSCE